MRRLLLLDTRGHRIARIRHLISKKNVTRLEAGIACCFFSQLLRSKVLPCKHSHTREIDTKKERKSPTVVKIFAPSENPTPNIFLLGHFSRAHLTVCLTSHVARAL